MAMRSSSHGALKAFLALTLVAGCSEAAGPGQAASSVPVPDAGAKQRPAVVPDTPPPTGPQLLSASGLYDDVATKKLASGVREFVPRFALFSDGEEKKRFLALPPGATIDTTDMDVWKFPAGTKVWKEFWVEGRLIETRLLEKLPDDEWWMMAYVWRADGSDADASLLGVAKAAGTNHDVPSQLDCRKCHAGGHSAVLGVSAIQLSNGGAGLLSKFVADGLLSAPPSGEFEVPGNDVERAAFGYLHANCGHCHNEHTGLHNQSPLRLALKTTDKLASDTGAMKSVGVVARHIVPPDINQLIVPGAPDESQLFVRMAFRESWAMPPLGTKIGDLEGTTAVYRWIKALP